MVGYTDKNYNYNSNSGYKADLSDNSILGNSLRQEFNALGLKLGNKIAPKLSEKKAREFLRKHRSDKNNHKDAKGFLGLQITDNPDDAHISMAQTSNKKNYMYGSRLTMGRSNLNKYVLAHEVGHELSSRDPNSYNRKSFLNHNPEEKIRSKKTSELEVRSEEEAWDKANELLGVKDLSKVGKFIRKNALGTYYRNNESSQQITRYNKDKDYRNQMNKRSLLKLSGAGSGAGLGYAVSKLTLPGLIEKRDLLKSKLLTTVNLRKRQELKSKISNLDLIISGSSVGLTGLRTLSGYKIAKRLSKNIDLNKK